jgi:hypothetical protein
VASADGWLSLLVRNGLAPAMRDGLRGDWVGARAAFDSRGYVNRLGLPARAHTPAELDDALAAFGRRPERWCGVRVFSDHRDGGAPSRDELEQLLAAECEAGRRDPYRSVAALLHLTYSRSQSTSSNGAPTTLAVRGGRMPVSSGAPTMDDERKRHSPDRATGCIGTNR